MPETKRFFNGSLPLFGLYLCLRHGQNYVHVSPHNSPTLPHTSLVRIRQLFTLVRESLWALTIIARVSHLYVFQHSIIICVWCSIDQSRVWHSYGFWHKWISEYIKKMTRTNIPIYLYEIFWHKRISEYICIKILIRTNIRINIWIENIWIFEYIRHSLD